jgi:hypothetical protein
MKCSALPTPSTEMNVPGRARLAAGALQAVLFSEILKPLAAGLGPAGDVAVESVVQHLFVPAQA